MYPKILFIMGCIFLFCPPAFLLAQDKPQLIVEKANSEAIQSIHYSPDGKKIIVSCPKEGTVKIWEVASGRLTNTIAAEASDAWFSQNSQYIIIRENKGYSVYDDYLNTFKYAITQMGGELPLLSFANSDKWLLLPRRDSGVNILETRTGKVLSTIALQQKNIVSANLCRENGHLIGLGADSSIRIIDTLTGSLLFNQKIRGMQPVNVCISEGGKYAAIEYYAIDSSNFQRVNKLFSTALFETATGKQLLSDYKIVALAPDDSSVVIKKREKDSSLSLLRLPDLQLIDTLPNAQIQYSQNGKQLFLFQRNGIQTINAKNGIVEDTTHIAFDYVLWALRAKAILYMQMAHPHDENSSRSLESAIWTNFKLSDTSFCSAISPDGASLALGFRKGQVMELSESPSYLDTFANADPWIIEQDARFAPQRPNVESTRVLHNNGITFFDDPFTPIIDAAYVPKHPYIFTKTWDNIGIIWNTQNASIKFKKDLNYFGLEVSDMDSYFGFSSFMSIPGPTVFSTDGKFFSLYNSTSQTLWKTDSLLKILPVVPPNLQSDIQMLYQKFAVSPDGTLVCGAERSEDDPHPVIHIYKMNVNTGSKREIHTINWSAFFPGKDGQYISPEHVQFTTDARHMVLQFYGQQNKVPFDSKVVKLKDGITMLGINPLINENNETESLDSLHAAFSKELGVFIVCTNNTMYYVSAETGRIIKNIKVQLKQPQIIKNLDFDPQIKYAVYNNAANGKVYTINIKTGKPLYALSGTNNSFSSIAFSPDNNRFATLTEDKSGVTIWNLLTGDSLLSFTGHTTRLLNVAYSADGKFLLCCAQDGSYEKRDAQTGKLIYTFFLFKDYDYAIVLPEGYYFSSSRNEVKYLNFRLRNKLYNFSQFDLQFNRPDKVLSALGSTDSALINAYHEAWKKRIGKSGFQESDFENTEIQMPYVNMLNTKPMPKTTAEKTIAPYFMLADSLYKIVSYSISINDVPLFGMNGIQLEKPVNNQRALHKIELDSGVNKIEISCTNEKGVESRKETFYITYLPPQPPPSKTWFIGVGVNKYSQNHFLPDLSYCVKDIRDMAAAIKAKYADVEIDTLLNEEASQENILALKKRLLQTGVNDRVIISFNGHGMNVNNEFYYAAPAINPQFPAVAGVSFTQMQTLLDSIPARKKLLLIDACHSGEADADDINNGIVANGMTYIRPDNPNTTARGVSSVEVIDVKSDDSAKHIFNIYEMMKTAFVDLRKNNGAIVIVAAHGNQQAFETKKDENGLFTKCFLNQMVNPSLKVSELLFKINEAMKAQTLQQQSVSRQELSESDWALW